MLSCFCSSTIFFYLSAISLAGQLIAAPLTYIAMSYSDWFAVFVGFVGLAASTLATLVAPDTHGMSSTDSEVQDTFSELPQIGLRARAASTLQHAAVAVRSVFWDSKQLGLLLSTYLFTSLSKNMPVILMQYVTKRFQWTWAEVRYKPTRPSQPPTCTWSKSDLLMNFAQGQPLIINKCFCEPHSCPITSICQPNAPVEPRT
jgi:hypothetical protein